MYSGVAAPASPASTWAASPGARRSRKKLMTATPSATLTSCSRRRMTTLLIFMAVLREPLWRLSRVVEPRIFERAVDLVDAGDGVFQIGSLHGEEVQLKQRDRWQIGLYALLQFLEQRDALGLAGRGLGLLDQLIGFGAAVTRTIAPRDVLADRIAPVSACHPHQRIGKAGEPHHRQVVVAVAVDALGVSRRILCTHVDVNTDALQRLLDIFPAALVIVAVRQVVEVDTQAGAVGAALEAGFVKQG